MAKKDTEGKSTVEKAAEQYQQDEAAQPSKRQKIKGSKSKFAFKKKKKEVVHEDAALEQLELLFDVYNIDIESMQEDDLEYAESIESHAKVILQAIMLKEVEIYVDRDDDGKLKVKQYIQRKSAKNTLDFIVYGELEGNDNSSMPEGKKYNNNDKMYALLGSMAEGENIRTNEAVVRKLRAKDVKTAHSLANLFLVP